MSVDQTLGAWRSGVGRVTSGLAIAAVAIAGLGTASATAQEAEVPFEYDTALAESGIDGSYGYFRTLDGTATVVQTDGERIQVEVNEPILVGDHVFVAGGSRAELVLADRNLVRVGSGAELGFRALARSADAADASSVLDLRRGTLQLVVVPGQLGEDFPSVVTPNANVQARAAGTYLIVVDDDEHTEVVVREGRADVLTSNDGAEVRPGESVFVEGRGAPRLQFAAAPSVDRLEQWGNQLSEYGYVEGEYIDDDLRYAASDLDDHGSWIQVSGGHAWRPYVSAGWAPYRQGRWRYTPSGLFWVSYEPWGWVPYHYGYWDHVPAYGWVWFPGRRFAPAHVYWYWGPQYAGWIPVGYYARHYGKHYGRGFGFYFGVYGHVGGGFGPYRYWSFCPPGRLGHRRQHIYTVHGYDLGRRGGRLGQGILTTDTRGLGPDVWRRPAEGVTRLRSLAERRGRTLPDARAFVERTPRLPAELERVTLRGGARGSGAVTRGNPAGVSRPNVETRTRDPEARTPRLQSRGGAARAGSADGTLRTSPGADRRAAGTLRRPEGGALGRPESGVRRPAAARPGAGAGANERPALRRPEVRNRESSATLRRPATPNRPSVERGSSGSGSNRIRVPETRSRSEGGGRVLRRPTQPVTRSPSVRSSTPETRPAPSRPRFEPRSAPSSRPTLRRPTGSSSRPAVRQTPTPSNRPSVRRAPTGPSRPTVRSAPAPSRPTVRPTPTPTRRPSLRGSGGSGSRPQVRQGTGSGGSRPQVRQGTGSGGSRPQVRRSTGSGSRPQVRRSSGGSGSRARGGSGGRGSSGRGSGGS